MTNTKPAPGDPADRYYKALDRLNHRHRIDVVRITEIFLTETLAAGIDAGVIDDTQADALKTLAVGAP